MTHAEIEALSDEAVRRVTPGTLATAPLSKRERARVKELRWQAAYYSRRGQALQPDVKTYREKKAAYGG